MSGSAARTVVVRLTVQDDDVRKKLEALGQQGEVSLKQIEKAANDASPGMLRLASVTDGLGRSMGGFGAALISPTAAITALTTAAVGAGVAIAKVGDEMVQTQARLAAATGSAEAAGRVLADLTKLGQQTGVAVSESAGAFARFAIAAREVGATNTQLVALVRTVQQAGIIAGASTQETTATVLQLGQALASGRLQGDELRSIMESMPNLAEALARALNVSVGQLREMGSEGKLTAEVVMNGLARAGEQINAQFERMPVTMGRAFDILGVSMTNFIGRLDQALGLSQAIARAVQAAARGIDAAAGAATPLTPGERAAQDVASAEARRGRLETELAQLRGEPGYYAAPRRGTTSRAMQEAGAQLRSPAERIADLERQIAQENQVIESGLERRNAIARQEREVEEAEAATAASRRNAAARQASTQAFNTARDGLDRERKLREDHRRAIEVIDRGLIVGATDQAEATRLRDLANRQLDEGLKRLTGTQGRNNEAQREANDLAREYNTLRRDTTGVLTMNEADSLAAREIARQIRGTQADPAVRLRGDQRILEEVRRDAQRIAREIESDNKRVTDGIVSYGASAFADMFESNKGGWKGMLENFQRTARAVFARIAAEAIIRPIVAPIVSGLGLGSLGSGGGMGGLNFGGLFGGAPVASAAGSTSAAMQSGQQSLGLYSVGRYGNLSAAFTTPGAYATTGWGGLDAALNYNLISPTFGTAATDAALAGMGAGMYGPATPSSLAATGLTNSVTPGLTVANTVGAGASILGGAYGIYSGVQKGGIGGAVGAIGGAVGMASGAVSAGVGAGLLSSTGMLAALGPYGMIAAAVLSIVGALLPGQKPSGKGQEFRYDLGSGDVERNGLTGNRYSAENASQAELATRGIVDLANKLGERLGGLRNDGQVAVGVTSSRGDGPGTLYLEVNGKKGQFANDEEGAKQLADRASQLLLEQLRERATGDYRGILNASGNSIEKLDENLTWYETTYKSLTGAADATSAFAQQVKSLTDQWQASIDKANELGLATARLNERRDEEIAKLHAQRDMQVRGFDVGLDIRMAQATAGDSTDALRTAALLQFDWQAQQQLAQARDTLESLGLTSDEVTRRIARNEEVLAAERLAVQREYSGQSVALQQQAAGSALSVVTSMRDYVRGLSTSDAAAGTVMDRYAAAERDFSAIYGAAAAGDANSIAGLQGAAETYRTLAREVYGGGQGYADALRLIGDRLDGVVGMGAEAITQSFIRENDRQNFDRLNDTLDGGFGSLRNVIGSLQRDINMLLMRPPQVVVVRTA